MAFLTVLYLPLLGYDKFFPIISWFFILWEECWQNQPGRVRLLPALEEGLKARTILSSYTKSLVCTRTLIEWWGDKVLDWKFFYILNSITFACLCHSWYHLYDISAAWSAFSLLLFRVMGCYLMSYSDGKTQSFGATRPRHHPYQYLNCSPDFYFKSACLCFWNSPLFEFQSYLSGVAHQRFSGSSCTEKCIASVIQPKCKNVMEWGARLPWSLWGAVGRPQPFSVLEYLER